jgi:hypothetical protein
VQRIRLIATASLAAAFLSGCGGDDDGGTKTVTQTTPPPAQGDASISKAEYIKRADAICAKYNELTKDLQDETPDSFEEAADLYTKAIELFKPAVKEFEALPPPRGDEQVIESYLDTVRQQVVLYQRIQAAAEQSDRAKLESYAEDVRELRAKARGLAEGYGFEVCGKQDE